MTSIGAIFDWDGVVIDSAALHERSWDLLAEEEGRSLPPGHFKSGFGKKNEVIIPDILEWTREPAEIHRLSLRKESLYRDLLRESPLEPLAGVRDLLEALNANSIPCAVGSSTHRENLDAVFQTSGLGRYFSAVVSAEDVNHGKPNPEVFLKCAERLERLPSQCVVFEDAFVGIEAAHRAGMKCVAVATTNPVEALHAADVAVVSLADVTVEKIRGLFSVY